MSHWQEWAQGSWRARVPVLVAHWEEDNCRFWVEVVVVDSCLKRMAPGLAEQQEGQWWCRRKRSHSWPARDRRANCQQQWWWRWALHCCQRQQSCCSRAPASTRAGHRARPHSQVVAGQSPPSCAVGCWWLPCSMHSQTADRAQIATTGSNCPCPFSCTTTLELHLWDYRP